MLYMCKNFHDRNEQVGTFDFTAGRIPPFC